ncbi:MAG TPA: PPOX class F420-dependent oxidoreductase [Streptosporangiaceae bacterium]|jgi:PPOX class probable F420-dependent enzyme
MTTASEIIPADYRDLLERPLYGHLATARQDGTVQVEPMWFEFDGEFIKFTHTSKRQKYRNLMANPSAALSVNDPDQPYRFLEVRGVLDHVDPDPEGVFYRQLSRRYGGADQAPPDAPDRVVLFIRPTATARQ